MDEYLDAMEAVVEQIEDPTEGVAASEWPAWARAYAATISPLNRALGMPRDPEPTYTAPRAVHGAATKSLDGVARSRSSRCPPGANSHGRSTPAHRCGHDRLKYAARGSGSCGLLIVE